MVPLRQPNVLPGFRLTLGFTLLYLSLMVLIPLASVFVKTSALTWNQFWGTVLAVVMPAVSFLMLLTISLLQWWGSRYHTPA